MVSGWLAGWLVDFRCLWESILKSIAHSHGPGFPYYFLEQDHILQLSCIHFELIVLIVYRLLVDHHLFLLSLFLHLQLVEMHMLLCLCLCQYQTVLVSLCAFISVGT